MDQETICASKDENSYNCDVCKKTFLSQIQADMHSAGKKHLKNVAKQANQDQKMVVGSTCEVCNVPLNSPDIEKAHYAGKKHQNNVAKQANPDQKIAVTTCEVCKVPLGSPVIATAHYAGKKHARNVSIKEGSGYVNESNQPTSRCNVCDVSLMSEQQAEMHNKGKKHLKNVEKQEKGECGGSAFCDICEVSLPSEDQTNAHYAGKKHQNNLIKKQGGDPINNQMMDTSDKETIVCKSLSDLGIHLSQYTSQAASNLTGRNQEEAIFRAFKIMCGVCMVQLGSKTVAEVHLKGAKHEKKSCWGQKAE